MGKPNEFTKSTNLFARALNSILKKADMPMETPPEPNGVGDGKDALVDECLSMLNDGSLPADPQKVQEWATSKGLSEQEAADFAEAILTDFFDTEDDDMEKGGDMDLPEGDDEGEEIEADLQKAALAMNHYVAQIDKKLKSISLIQANLEVITKGLTTLLTSNSELVNTNNMMKASLEKLGFTPASKANPVYSATGNKPSGIDSMPFGKKKEILMKGISAGKSFSPAEVNLFESSLGTQLTDNIKNFINENKDGK